MISTRIKGKDGKVHDVLLDEKLLRFLHAYARKFGHPPSFSRVVRNLRPSQKTEAMFRLFALEDAGWIEFDPAEGSIKILVSFPSAADRYAQYVELTE